MLLVSDMLNTKSAETGNNVPDTTSFIYTSEFKRLTKISFDVRIKEIAKSFASESQVDNALEIADKNREKIKKLQTTDFSCFTGKNYFENDGSPNITLLQMVLKSPVHFKIFWMSLGVNQTRYG